MTDTTITLMECLENTDKKLCRVENKLKKHSEEFFRYSSEIKRLTDLLEYYREKYEELTTRLTLCEQNMIGMDFIPASRLIR